MTRQPVVLVIGVGPLRERFFAAAAAMGIGTILVDESAYSRYDRLADWNYAWRLTDHGRPGPDRHLLDQVAAEVDGVLALNEWGARLAAEVALEHGLPGAGATVASALADKASVRSRLVHTDGCVRFALASDSDPGEAESLLESAGSVIVKPADGAASLGIWHVDQAEQLRQALTAVGSLAGDGRALVEEYVPGREFSVEVAVEDGSVGLVVVTEKTSTRPPRFIETRHVVDPRTQELLGGGAARFAGEIVSGLDIKNAILHIEAKNDGGNWRLIEVAFRPAGGLIVDIALRATGVDLYKKALAGALGRPELAPSREYSTPSVAAVQFLAGTGTVADAPSVAGVRRGLPRITRAERLLPPGTVLDDVTANWWRAGYVQGHGPDREELLAQLSAAVERLTALTGLTRLPDD